MAKPELVEKLIKLKSPNVEAVPPEVQQIIQPPIAEPAPPMSMDQLDMMTRLKTAMAQGLAPAAPQPWWKSLLQGAAQGLAYGPNAPQVAMQREQLQRQKQQDLANQLRQLEGDVRQQKQDNLSAERFAFEKDQATEDAAYREKQLAAQTAPQFGSSALGIYQTSGPGATGKPVTPAPPPKPPDLSFEEQTFADWAKDPKNAGKTRVDYEKDKATWKPKDTSIDDQRRFARANMLRDDYGKTSQPIRDRADSYDFIDSIRNEPAGGPNDIVLIYNFVKMQDPNAVREGELQLVQQGASIPDRWKRYIQGYTEGVLLAPEQRKKMITAADNLYQTSVLPKLEEINAQYEDSSKRYDVDPRDVVRPIRGRGQRATPGKIIQYDAQGNRMK